MLTDELEHLDVVLQKQPIIATWTAQDILDRPEVVRDNYLQHVRSFVIIGKVKSSSDEEQFTIADYEKRLLKLVKSKGAAKGYITADYGYGKTSTAAFIWQQCEQAEIVAVPPFQIQKLDHLLSATFGWVRFKLEHSYPHLVDEAQQIYNRYINRDIDAESSSESERALLRRMYDEGRYSLDLRGVDYVGFFEEMTELVLKAGYNGLIIIADELQQYIDPDIKSGVRDPLTSLFDIVQALMTRKGYLPFALLLSLPLKELGLINDQRGDLVQRLKSDELALDLSVIYNQTFARDLWKQLARELHFESLREKIVLPETLDALGQISARSDLATGPRTVVDVFKLMTKRYLDAQGEVEPFDPLDLVNAFLQREVSYDNLSKLQLVVNGHLTHQFVRDNADYQRAIKLMGAFPIDGLEERYFDTYGVRNAIAGLMREAQGDIITFAGGGIDDDGRPRELRALLVGLEQQKVNTDWLNTTIREFTRNYIEQSPRMRALAIRGFQNLLKEQIFKGDNWKNIRSWDSTFTQNRTYIFEGAFPNTTRRNYPDRLIQIQIVAEGEQVLEPVVEGDLVITFQLLLNYDKPEQERRTQPGAIGYPQPKVTKFILNMSYNSGKESYGDLHSTLGPVVAPWKITPTLLLSLYAYLEEKRENRAIPKVDEEFVRANYQPALIDHAYEQLFNPELGVEMGASGVRIVENVIKRELEKYYGQYRTLITSSQWKQSLKKYHLALENLPTPYERQGSPYPSTRQDLATTIFRQSVPALETFIATNPLLIKQENANTWRFTLHPLEEQIMKQLKGSHLSEPPRMPGGKPRPSLSRDVVMKVARNIGYRAEEFEEVLVLLEKRGLISFKSNRLKIVAEEMRVPQATELRGALKDYHDRLKVVKEALQDNPQVDKWLEDIGKYHQLIERLAVTPDEQRQTTLDNTIRNRFNDLNAVIQTEQNRIAQDIKRLLKQVLARQDTTAVLNQPLQEGFFHSQLDTQRQSLLKEGSEVAGTCESLRKRLENLLGIVDSPSPLPVEDLLRSAQVHQDLRNNIYRVEQQAAQLERTLSHYSKGRLLLQQAVNLQQRFQNVVTDTSVVFQKELDAWALGITGELSSQKLGALANESEWQERFDAIRQRFEQTLQTERERFAHVQTDYRTFLLSRLGGIAMWAEVAFNPGEPQDSYKRLWGGVHEVLQESVSKVRGEMQAAYDRAARLQGGALLNLPQAERPAKQTELNELLAYLSEYMSKTAKWAEGISGPRFTEKVSKDGAIRPAEEVLEFVIKQISDLRAWLQGQQQSLTSIEQGVMAASPSDEEQAILAVLANLQKENGSLDGIEIGLLLQHLGAKQGISWQNIASLYSKQRLRIKIAPVIFD
jgi:hypothetical protein